MPKIDRAGIYQRDNGLCGFCGGLVPFDLMHLDHIEPKGLGGPTIVENLRVAHRRCNIVAGKAVVRERRLRGIVPDPSAPRLIYITMPKPLLAQIRAIAQCEDRSLRTQIMRMLREWVEREGNR